MTQPLDVAYFRPLKIKWRQVLTQRKQSESGKTVATLPKDIFPRLLKKVLDELKPNEIENLKSGFKKAGIHPINKDEVLKRLPSKDVSVNLELVGETFIHHLEQKRKKVVQPRTMKRQKLDVAPGKSITVQNIIEHQEIQKNQKEQQKKEKELKKKQKHELKEKQKLGTNTAERLEKESEW